MTIHLEGQDLGSFWVGAHMGIWERSILGEVWKRCALSHTSLMHFFHLAAPQLYPFTINQ